MNSKANLIIISISILACLFLFWLIYFFEGIDGNGLFWVKHLSKVNASLNALSAIFLVKGFIEIKKGLKLKHQRSMKLAFLSSSLFLISYIIYHSFHGDSKFLGTGMIRPIYFSILISHILLSVIALPMVLMTFYLAITKDFSRHKKLAKWTFPVWLYVSITGVLVFAFLKFTDSL